LTAQDQEERVRCFTLLIHDDRYSVPTLLFATAPDETGACEVADRELYASKHHLAVDVAEDERQWFRVRRDGLTMLRDDADFSRARLAALTSCLTEA